MKKSNTSKPVIIVIDLLIFSVCMVGLYQIANRPGLPFEVSNNDNMTVVNVNDSTLNIKTGDIIRDIDGLKLSAGDELEIYLDTKKIGDAVTINLERDAYNFYSNVSLVNYYTLFYVILAGSIGLIFFLFALFVVMKRYSEPEAHIFHWLSIGVAMIMMLTWGSCPSESKFIASLTRTGFHIGYTFTPALLAHFVLIFPVWKHKSISILTITLYMFAGILAILLTYQFINYINEFNSVNIYSYIFLFNIARILIATSVVFSIFTLIRAYKNSVNQSDRKKLKWIIFGLCIGPFLFIFLWVLPQLILNQNFVPEELIIISILSVPVCFSVSIIKYHLFDIDILIRRSLVYSILISVMILMYTAIVLLITGVFEREVASVLFAILIGLLFQPAKLRVQKFVDKKFFKVQYDFRTALRELFRTIRDISSIGELAEKTVSGVVNLIPVMRIGLFLLESPENRIKLIAHKNFELLVGRSVRFQKDKLKTDLSLPVAIEGKVEHGVNIEIADLNVFRRWKIDIVFPLKASSGAILGFLVLGEKKSGDKFNVEDVDLLNTLCVRIASSLERIKLQEEVVREHLEAERLEELNRMKSFFVSTVSHDLKTPITSIKMFSGMLRNSESIADSEKEYLNIIEGESNRLTRLIDNVLNYSIIEKGKRIYKKSAVSLNRILDEVISAVNYQLKLEKFNLIIKKTDSELFIYADRDAVKEAVINLISNSIKYSDQKKEISILLYQKADYAVLEITDKGIGMSLEEKENIFNEFYQIAEKGKENKGGVGLGLTIVKHVMDAHNGKIELESEPLKGTTIKLIWGMTNGKKENTYN